MSSHTPSLAVYVDLPSKQARSEILATHARRLKLDPALDLAILGSDDRCVRQAALPVSSSPCLMLVGRCEGYTGADLAALCREAGSVALRRLMEVRIDLDYCSVTPFDLCTL